jgi:hypothetical protein
MQIITLILAALFVYLLFFRKGGMGMGCCGSHGSHSGHGHEPDKDRHFDELSENRKEDVIDLREDQYTVLTVEEDKHPKTPDRTASQQTN